MFYRQSGQAGNSAELPLPDGDTGTIQSSFFSDDDSVSNQEPTYDGM